MTQNCEFHRCDLPATIIFKWPDRQKAACHGHAVEFYRASLDPQPMNSIAGTIERGAMTKPDDGRNHSSWRERLYRNLGLPVHPLYPTQTEVEHQQMAGVTERLVQGWHHYIAGWRAGR